MFAIFLLIGLSSAMPADAKASEYPCHWVKGRMSAYNGTPTYRIWPRGTNRLLGVISRDRATERNVEDRLPIAIRKLSPRFGRQFWGEFRFCPTTPERAGWMRFGYLTSARNITVVDN